MGGIIFALFFIPIVLICCFGVPVLMGFLVYRDAVKRDTNPWLWALVAAFVPSFIGLLIYLLVRNDYAVLAPGEQRTNPSAKANNPYNEDNKQQGTYDSTTYEYRSYTNADGETVTERVPKKKEGLPTWAKVLIVIGIVLVVVALLAMIAGVIQYIFGYGGISYYHNGFNL